MTSSILSSLRSWVSGTSPQGQGGAQPAATSSTDAKTQSAATVVVGKGTDSAMEQAAAPGLSALQTHIQKQASARATTGGAAPAAQSQAEAHQLTPNDPSTASPLDQLERLMEAKDESLKKSRECTELLIKVTHSLIKYQEQISALEDKPRPNKDQIAKLTATVDELETMRSEIKKQRDLEEAQLSKLQAEIDQRMKDIR